MIYELSEVTCSIARPNFITSAAVISEISVVSTDITIRRLGLEEIRNTRCKIYLH